MYMRHNSAGTERLHGVAKDIPADCLHNVFAEFWPVRFQPLPFFCAADAHVGDSIAAELVGADLWLDVAEPSPRWQRNEQHPAGAGKPDSMCFRFAFVDDSLHDRLVHIPPKADDIRIRFPPCVHQGLQFLLRNAHFQSAHGLQSADAAAVAERELSDFPFLPHRSPFLTDPFGR